MTQLDPQTTHQIQDFANRVGASLFQQLTGMHADGLAQAAQAAQDDPTMTIKQQQAADERAAFLAFQAWRDAGSPGVGTKEGQPAPAPAAVTPPAPANEPGEDEDLDALTIDDEGDVTNAVGDVLLAADEVKAIRFVMATAMGEMIKNVRDPRIDQVIELQGTITKALRGLVARIQKIEAGDTSIKSAGETANELTAIKSQLAELMSDQPILFDATARGIQELPRGDQAGSPGAPNLATKNQQGPSIPGGIVGFVDQVLDRVPNVGG